MPSGTVKLLIEGPVARLRIENPPLNVLTLDVRHALIAHLDTIDTTPGVKVVIVEGQGDRAFSAGADIKEFPDTEAGGVAKITLEQYSLNRLANLAQVTIARLSGHVLGGGGELMLACDLRVASEDATIGFPEIRLGALPAAGGMQRLAREVGPARARELVLTGAIISASEAYRMGLINKVVAHERLSETTNAMAERLAAAPSDALRLAKRCIAAAVRQEVDSMETQAFGELCRGSNLREGVAAFLEKRPALFDPAGGNRG